MEQQRCIPPCTQLHKCSRMTSLMNTIVRINNKH